MSKRSEKVTTYLTPEVMRRFDKFCAADRRTRSAEVALLIEAALHRAGDEHHDEEEDHNDDQAL
jgi:hypothetical protein